MIQVSADTAYLPTILGCISLDLCCTLEGKLRERASDHHAARHKRCDGSARNTVMYHRVTYGVTGYLYLVCVIVYDDVPKKLHIF